MNSKPYVMEHDGRYGVMLAPAKPLREGTKVHGAFKTLGGALHFARAANEGEIITHAVAERRAREALAEEAALSRFRRVP